MKTKHLLILFVIALVALFVGSGLLSNKQGESQFQQQNLLPELDWSLLSSIKLSNNDDTQQVTLNTLLQQWIVVEKDGYQADTKKLSELVTALKSAQIVELKTKAEKNYHRLGLDLTKAEAKLLTLKVVDKTFELVLGNANKNGSGQYVRLLPEVQTYLIDQSFELELAPESWIESDVFSLSFEQATQISVAFEQGGSFVIHRPEIEQADRVINTSETDLTQVANQVADLAKTDVEFAQDFELKSTSENIERELKYSTIFSGLARNLLNISANNVELSTAPELKQTTKVASFNIVYNDKEQAFTTDLTLYKVEALESETENQAIKTQYFVHRDETKYWLSISEFDFNQISKPFGDYFEPMEEQK